MSSLFALTEDAQRLADAIAAFDQEGQSDEQFSALLGSFLDEIQLKRAEKIDSIAYLIDSSDASAKAKLEMADRLVKSADRDTKRADALRKYAKAAMDQAGTNKLKGGTREIAYRLNGGVLPTVWFTEDGRPPNPDKVAIPTPYVKVEKRAVVDTKAVRLALESGVDLGFAGLGERGGKVTTQ